MRYRSHPQDRAADFEYILMVVTATAAAAWPKRRVPASESARTHVTLWNQHFLSGISQSITHHSSGLLFNLDSGDSLVFAEFLPAVVRPAYPRSPTWSLRGTLVHDDGYSCRMKDHDYKADPAQVAFDGRDSRLSRTMVPTLRNPSEWEPPRPSAGKQYCSESGP